jgi:hypothetical protein
MTINIGTPHTKGAGYFVNGLNLTPNQGREEADIRTCPHCQYVIKMQEWKNDGAWCYKCNAPVCGTTGNPLCVEERRTYGCMPFMKKLELFTKGQVALTAFRKLAGLDSPPPDHQPSIIVGGK